MVGTTTTLAAAHDSGDVPVKAGRVRKFATSLASFVTFGLIAGGKAGKDELDDEGASTDPGNTSDSASDTESYTSSAEDCSSDFEEEQHDEQAGADVYGKQMLLKMRPPKNVMAQPDVKYSTQPRPQYVEETMERNDKKDKKSNADASPKDQKGTKSVVEDSPKGQKSDAEKSPTEKNAPWRSAKVDSASKQTLKPSATSWAEMQRRRREGKMSDVPDDKAIERSMKSILNKLTIEKFEALYAQLQQCGMRTAGHVESLVAEVFQKATMQHHFIPMYADLCARLNAWFEKEGTPGNCNFRKVLLDQCQSQFEKSLEPMKLTSNDDASEEERQEEAAQYKKRMLGNIRLVGELLTRKMLSPKVLIGCSTELLAAPFVPDRLESLAALLTTAGPTFDDPAWPYHAVLGHTFARILDVVNDTSVSPRVRFLLRDLLELRNSGWKDQKKVTAKEGPKKIEEIHEDAARENAAKDPPRPQRCNGSSNSQQQRDNNASNNRPRDNNTSNSGSQRCQAISGKKTTSNPSNQSSPPRQHNKNTSSGKQAPALPSAQSTASDTMTKDPRSSQTPARGTPIDYAAKVKKAEECTRSLEAILSAANNVTSPPSSPTTCTMTQVAPAEAQNSANILTRFHVVLSSVMRELGVTHNTTGAVARIRGLKLPVVHQASEFTNILTRGAEETCGAKRRACFAFAAGLARGTFEPSACAEGVAAFCADVYEDLKEEVPQLQTIIAKELEPTLRPCLSEEQLKCLTMLA